MSIAIKGTTIDEKRMVKEMQASMGLEVDGSIGFDTFATMYDKFNPKYPIAGLIYGQPTIISRDILLAEVRGKPLSNYNYAQCNTFTYPRAVKPCSIFITANKVYCGNSCHAHLGKPETVLYKLNDGTMGVKRVIYSTELPKGVKWAFGGLGLLEMYNPVAEGFTGAFADVLRKTDHNLIWTRPDGRIFQTLCRNMTVQQINEWVKARGANRAVIGDGGGLGAINTPDIKVNTRTLQGVISQGIGEIK